MNNRKLKKTILYPAYGGRKKKAKHLHEQLTLFSKPTDKQQKHRKRSMTKNFQVRTVPDNDFTEMI